jgi:hypothetical protein
MAQERYASVTRNSADTANELTEFLGSDGL